MTEHEIHVNRTPIEGGCRYEAVCRECIALAEPIEVTHHDDDPEACGRARRSLYVWGREHAG